MMLLILAGALAPYALYAFPAVGVNSRFVLPAWPAVCILIGSGITSVLSRLRPYLRLVLVSVILIVLLLRFPDQLATLRRRNIDSAQSIEQGLRITAPTEPDSVIMSYVFNDIVAVYAHRSVLNYRHMVPYDPLSGTYRYDKFEDRLVQEVD